MPPAPRMLDYADTPGGGAEDPFVQNTKSFANTMECEAKTKLKVAIPDQTKPESSLGTKMVPHHGCPTLGAP